MSNWVWKPALLYIGAMLMVYAPDAYEVFLKPAMKGLEASHAKTD